MTAPASGSGTCPACTACVARRRARSSASTFVIPERKGGFRIEQATCTLAVMPQPNAMQCLVVDDEPRLRRVLVRLLEGDGFSCAEAGSGTEALEMLQREPVPLVISDLRMPQMDGVTL